MDHKQKIDEQKEKIISHFSDSQVLLDYLIDTLNNFFHRYLETTKNSQLTTVELAPKVWGAMSVETNSMEILKIKNPAIRPHLINAAKTLAAQGGLTITYTLGIEPKVMNAENGELIIFSRADWSKTPLTMEQSLVEKKIKFEYHSLGQFRKELALKLEEVCELFL